MTCLKHESTVWGWEQVSAAWLEVPQKVSEMSRKQQGILHCVKNGHPEYNGVFIGLLQIRKSKVICFSDCLLSVFECMCVTTGYLPFSLQLLPHIGLPQELCPWELLPLSAAAAASLSMISPGTSLPYVTRLALVSEHKYDWTNYKWL